MQLDALAAFDDNYIWTLTAPGGEAIVVDPGDAAPVLQAATLGLRPAAVLITHHHDDHCGGLAALRARWPDLPAYGPDDARIGVPVQRVRDGQVLEILGQAFAVLDVPGHTRSHVAFVRQTSSGELFCGDTLFSLGCGRMFEGSPSQMLASLDRLAALPEDTAVCCGHEYTLSNAAFAAVIDPGNADLQRKIEESHAMRQTGRPTLPSRIADERRCNPFLRVDSPAVQAAVGRHAGRALADRVDTFAELRRWKDGFRA